MSSVTESDNSATEERAAATGQVTAKHTWKKGVLVSKKPGVIQKGMDKVLSVSRNVKAGVAHEGKDRLKRLF